MKQVNQIYHERLNQVQTQVNARVEYADSLRFSRLFQQKIDQSPLADNRQDGVAISKAPAASLSTADMLSGAVSGAVQPGTTTNAVSANNLNSMMAMAMASSMGGMGMDSSGSSGGSGMLSQMMSMMMINQLAQSFSANQGTQGAATSKPAQAYNDLIEQTAAKYEVPAALVKAVVQAESGYRADAVSPSGAQGLMQLMPGTASALGVADSFDPAQNVDGGVRYLKQHLTDFNGDVRLALAAYNTGGARIKSLGITSSADAQQYGQLSSGVRSYVETVLGHMASYTV